jgi:PKD domain
VLSATALALLASAVGAADARAPRARLAALYNLASRPHASFAWFPASPRTRERILLVSTSTDATSAIVAYAWDVADDGPFGAFHAGGPAASASFATPASHVVRLRVTAADGVSSVASETIHMKAPAPGVLKPFPNVQITGRVLSSGVRLSFLGVRAPVQSRIRINCEGRGCPARSARQAAASRHGHLAWARFSVFERVIPSGVTLRIEVSKDNQIGSYTRFTVRHRKLPVRADACLSPVRLTPIACPSA